MAIVLSILLALATWAVTGLLLLWGTHPPRRLKYRAEAKHLLARRQLALPGAYSRWLLALGLTLVVLYSLLLLQLGNMLSMAVAALFGSSWLLAGLVVAWLLLPKLPVLALLDRSHSPLKWLNRLWWPLTTLLVWLLQKFGGDWPPQLASKDELAEYIMRIADRLEEPLSEHEQILIQRALVFEEQHAAAIMQPFKRTVTVKPNQKLTLELMEKLHNSGQRYIPVLAATGQKVQGWLDVSFVQDNLKQNIPVAELMEKRVHSVATSADLRQLLNMVQQTKQLIFVVQNEAGDSVGIVGFEHMAEAILGTQIGSMPTIVSGE